MMEVNQEVLERLIKEVLMEKLKEGNCLSNVDVVRSLAPQGVMAVKLPTVKVSEKDRLDTGNSEDVVYTKDLFTLQESPRLGCGVMEMKETTFDWHLNYDEIDYVIEGSLSIISEDKTVTAHAGELILIPKGAKIKFSVQDYARFIYVTYPADWNSQN